MTDEIQESSGVDVGRALAVISESWRSFAVVFVVGAIVAGIVAINLPNIYRATTLLVPVKSDAGVANGLRSQLGGLAAIAGIDIGGGGAGRTVEAMATLNSEGFARAFIEEDQLLPALFYEKWDATTGKWKSDKVPPTIGDGVALFKGKICSISDDRKSGVVTLRIDWIDRELAAKWANRMVERINSKLRAQAIEDSHQSIDYLEREIRKTNVVETTRAIYGLIESQMNAAMVANVQQEYAFKVIDPAIAPDAKRKLGPKRSLITFGGAVAASALWSLIVLWRGRRRWLVAL